MAPDPHTSPRRWRAAVGALGLAILIGVLGGCGSSKAVAVNKPLPTAPEPAVSPPAAADLPGVITDLPGAPEGVAITDSGTVAVNVRRPDGLDIFPLASDASPAARRFVPLGGSARHLTLGGPEGPALVPDETTDEFVQVALPSGRVLDSVRVGHQPHEAFLVGKDTYFVADELANTVHLVRNGRVIRVIRAPLQPGGGAESLNGRYAVVVGVRARRMWEYTAGGTFIGAANCGAGPTHTATGSGGLFWTNDTTGGAVLGFRLTSKGPEQVATIPTGAGSRPYGIAYDSRRHTLWVTLTGRDQVLGLTFDGTKVVHRSLRPTVQQPNTVAVYPRTGEIVVTGSTPAGHLQFLPGAG